MFASSRHINNVDIISKYLLISGFTWNELSRTKKIFVMDEQLPLGWRQQWALETGR